MCGKLYCTKPEVKTNDLQEDIVCNWDDQIKYSFLYTATELGEESFALGLVKDFTSCGYNKVNCNIFNRL